VARLYIGGSYYAKRRWDALLEHLGRHGWFREAVPKEHHGTVRAPER
jgi:hypothetical protein